MASQVDPHSVEPTFIEQPNADTALLRAARPVLKSLFAELENEPVCLILTDPNGLVLSRGGGNSSLLKKLDRVHLAPGFVYSEAEVGTNGIGTALEVGAPILVNGDEHFTGNLRRFSCAGAPITHPITGALMGVIDITTDAENTNALLLSFTKMSARRIQERVLEQANELNSALLSGYYAACRHSGGAVMAVSDKVLMMNSLAQQRFDASDQAALLDRTRESVGRQSASTFVADLPSGSTVRLAYQPTYLGDALAGGIIQIKEQQAPRRSLARDQGLPGLAGTNPVWRHAGHEVLNAITRSEWLVVEGETGCGKQAIIRAAHQHSARHRPLVVVEAGHENHDLTSQVAAELGDGADLVIRNAHRLSPDQVNGLASTFETLEDDASAQKPWLALATHPDADSAEIAHLLHFFPRTVEVPPLRHHLDDLPALVRLLLDQAGATELRFSGRALNQLMRLHWPGNIDQLRKTLLEILRSRRSGIIDTEDLPAECATTTRRSLSRMEALERDIIVEALTLHHGDKTSAAKSLGTSRATIYRKIRDYGIVT